MKNQNGKKCICYPVKTNSRRTKDGYRLGTLGDVNKKQKNKKQNKNKQQG